MSRSQRIVSEDEPRITSEDEPRASARPVPRLRVRLGKPDTFAPFTPPPAGDTVRLDPAAARKTGQPARTESMRKTTLDDLQRDVTFEFPPRRIVCLCPSLTETLLGLGLAERVVGRTRYCIHPARQVERVAVVGGTKDVDLDRVCALRPNLVIAEREENPRQVVDALADSLPVFVCNVTDYESALRTITSLGTLTGRTEPAAALVGDIRRAFADLRPRTTRRVAYLLWHQPYLAAGTNTYIHALLEKCGCENVCRDLPARYPEVTVESLQRLGPAWVLLSSEPFPFDDEHVAELAARLPAARVIRVDGEMFGWYGTHMLAATKYLAQLIRRFDAASDAGAQ